MDLKNKKVLFMGDSITYGCGTSCEESIFVNILKSECGLCDVFNDSIPGSRIARQKKASEISDYDIDFCKRVGENTFEADAVVVFGGTNDYGHGDAPLGSLGDKTPDTFYGACDFLITSLKEKYPDAVIVFMTPLHRENEDNLRGDGNKSVEVAPLKTYVEIIRQTADYYSIPVLDLYNKSGIQANNSEMKEKYMPDGVHINDLGHRIVADLLKDFLAKI